MSLVFNDQDVELGTNKLTNLDSNTVNRNSILYTELSNKKCVKDSVGKSSILGINQTLQNNLKVSVGNSVYKITKKIKRQQLLDTTIIKIDNAGGYLLQLWKIKCSDENNCEKKNFYESNENK